MWSPTHIQVTVQRAKGLLTKGKNGTNNCFVTIGLGKEKYQTSIKEKSDANVSWNEECELKIPDQGNKAELVLTCLHRNNLGIDEFLGQISLPLNEMDVYDRPRSKWFKLQSKPGKEKKNKERGELEVRFIFVVKSGSLNDLSKKEKHKSSIGQLTSSVGGSLLSLGAIEKRKSIKKFAKSLGSKMHLNTKKKNKDEDDSSISGSLASIDTGANSHNLNYRYGQRAGEADPGVISEDEDEFVFDNLSHKSSGSSLNVGSNIRVADSSKNITSNPSPLLNVPHNRWTKGKQEDERSNNNIQGSRKNTEYSELENESFLMPPPSNSENLHDVVANSENNIDLNEQYGLNPVIGITTKTEMTDYEGSNIFFANGTNIENDLNKESKMNNKKYNSKKNINKDFEATAVDKIVDLKETPEENNVDEWESKLYLDINKTDSLKRNSWHAARVQIPIANKSHDIEGQEYITAEALSANNIENGTEKPHETNSTDKSNREEKVEGIVGPSYESSVDVSMTVVNVSVSEDVSLPASKSINPKNEILSYEPPMKKLSSIVDFGDSSHHKCLPEKLLKYPEKSRIIEGEFTRSPRSNERVIIGHEKSTSAEKNSDLAAVLEKKYDGKSREELMFIAYGMENEVFKYRQRVKELEDYLDNLLLRVMETHPKILQNPYSRTTSTKSG